MNKPFANARSIPDDVTVDFLENLKIDFAHAYNVPEIDRAFCDLYFEWIASYDLNSVEGLDQFPYRVFSNGTTESFDKFYLYHQKKRFRCFKGEYMYHRLAWRNGFDWAFIEDAPLDKNDAVVISYPFSDTGNKHIDMDTVLEQCNDLGVPVLIDCAYYTISSGLDFDFTHSCITDITFSLSKMFPVANCRIGMRLTRTDTDDTLFVYDKANYTNRTSALIGIEFLEKFSPEYIVNKYKNKQIEFCQELDVVPSNTVLFGLDTKNKFPEYNRGTSTNRLSFHDFLNNDIKVFLNECSK